jgi:hypothetical protein
LNPKLSIVVFALTFFVAQYVLGQELPDPWKALPGTTAYDLKQMNNATLISSDAVAWPDGRSALVTYWRGGPTDTYYRCVDFVDSNIQSTGHSCWVLDSR